MRSYEEAFSPYWHPVAFSQELKDRPLAARLLGRELVVWRTASGVAVTQRYCAHRGADLCAGEVSAEGLRCAFHGWTYGRDGRCVHVPSQPGAPLPPNAALASYSATERYGLIWVCLAPEPAAPLPEWPELETGKVATVALPRLDWDVSAGRMMEIVLDVTHLSWVHKGTFGNPEQQEVPAYEVERTASGVRAQISYPALAPPLDGAPPKVDRTSLTYEVTFPFAVRLTFKPSLFFPHTVYAIASPWSEEKMQCFYFSSYHPALRHFPDIFVKSELAILEQDRLIAEAQRPRAHPLDFAGEVHVKADRLPIEYRRGVIALRLGRPVDGPTPG
ncbi:aromatic ring-hydroxylating dioxygenase subunit alpha [Vitiosangium sp. GDMCC 1.1324]|uniref:aromatic ring-hydroxylating dioxygenase subunit alpha n=1 Tax=Vitiosangium sp. (strain GDMCC 1.1324) TaxID=2138576 RepID=UPI000D3A4271|nr:aromatic ring-hydroxylating dioxygenase subunit alpha [Vitiosangium sp. GDMCC 1.1324]PTL79452.1 (2Fe-2S)-binding protein [Vitiosangium sp. GDMCC 1.1324]